MIDGGIWLTVRVVEHSTDERGMHFNNEVASADMVETKGAKGTKQAIKLKLSLQVARLTLIPQN